MDTNILTERQKEQVMANLRREYLAEQQAIPFIPENLERKKALKQAYLQKQAVLQSVFHFTTAHSEMNQRRRQAHKMRRKLYDIISNWQSDKLHADQAEVQFGCKDGRFVFVATIPYAETKFAHPRHIDRVINEALRKSVEEEDVF